jgi:hypothetical protein
VASGLAAAGYRVLRVSLVLFMIFSIQASADRPIAGAATLAQRSQRHCEPVHRRPPNQTFCDGRHSGAGDRVSYSPHLADTEKGS